MRFLIAENDGRIALHIQRGFKKEGIVSDICCQKDNLVSELRSQSYDLILLSTALPPLGGHDGCRELRQFGIKTAILMMGSQEALQEKVYALDAGADDYIHKPISLVELSARTRALLRRKKQFLTSTSLKTKDLFIDRNSRFVRRENKCISLSPKEFRILEYLILNHGVTKKRTEIIQDLWGTLESMFSNAIEVHISNLRTKLNEGFEKKLIKTIRGVGYLLE